MKTFNKIVLVLVVILAVLSFGRTFVNSGNKAISVMNSEEKALIEKVKSQIDNNSTREEVFDILGEPTEDVVLVAKWNGLGGSFLNQGRVYFIDGKAGKFRLMKIGYFFYEIEF